MTAMPPFLESLLDGAELELKALGELGELVRGNGLPKSDFTDSGVPAIHYGQIYTYYKLSTHSTISYVSPETAATLKKVFKGDVVITNTSENLEDVATPLVYLAEEPAVTGGHATIFKPNSSILGMYFAYFTQTPAFAAAKRKLAKGTKVIDVSAKDMAKIPIPIPCPDQPERSLAIQAEIVRILDSFTALTAELTAELNAELTARQKQYNHYRDQLLTFDDSDAEWKTLGEVAEFRRGSFPQPYGNAEWYGGKGEMPFVQVVDVSDRGLRLNSATKKSISATAQPKSVFVKSGTVLVTLQGTIGRVAITQYDCYVDRTLAIFTRIDDKIDRRYFAYQLREKFETEKEKARGSTLKTITKADFKEFKIAVPKMAIQARIVAILDKFDTLTTSLSEGLPREIKQREQQYAYYRDLLFSFPKANDAPAGHSASRTGAAIEETA